MDTAEVGRRARRHITLRLIPFLVLLYLIAFIDRVNVGYAKLQMADELKFSDAVYGFGAGIFFIGYVLLEIPGTLLVERWSARLWISRIMITWGFVAMLMGFVHTQTEFYWLRFLLGAAEAGFFPGIIVYITHWFPAKDRARALALFLIGSPIANIIGAPISGLIMEHVHWYDLAGWRWVFILEGLPAVLVGVIVIFYLTDRPHQAAWLPADERAWLISELERERQGKEQKHSRNYWAALKDREVLLLTCGYLGAMTGLYGFNLWLPSLLKQFSHLSIVQVSFLSTLPYITALAALQVVGRSSDRSGERVWHTVAPLFAASAALLAGTFLREHLLIAFILLCVTGGALWAYLPSFWSLPSTFLAGSAAAVAVGLINSIGNLGGYFGPWIVGKISDQTHSLIGGMVFLSGALGVAGLCILLLGRAKNLAEEPSKL